MIIRSHSDEDEDHQVCEVVEALETEINTDDGALTAAFGSTPISTSRQALSTLLQHPTTSAVVGTTVEVLHTTANDIAVNNGNCRENQKCKTHQQAHDHQEAMQLADDFSMSVEKPELTTVTVLIDKTRVANIERNRTILKAVAEAILLCEVRNMLDKLKNCSLFFQHSPKRNNLLEHIVNNKLKDHPAKHKALLQLCKTRWAERHNAYQHFYQAYTFIVEALEMIGHGQHVEEHGSLFSDWDAENCSAAQQILSSITTFEFSYWLTSTSSICLV
ncbi:hypothetical protein EMCRGX_G033566 [Ephydatia muelleri]